MKYTIEDFDNPTCDCVIKGGNDNDDSASDTEEETFVSADLRKISSNQKEIQDFINYAKEHSEIKDNDKLLDNYITYILEIADKEKAESKKKYIMEETDKLIVEKKEKSKLTTGLSVGVIILVIIVATIFIIALFRRKQKPEDEDIPFRYQEEDIEEPEITERIRGGNDKDYEFEYRGNHALNSYNDNIDEII